MGVFSEKCKGQIIPVFYHKNYDVCEQVMRACYAGGVRVFELTNRGESAYTTFVRLHAVANYEMPDLCLGVGSIVHSSDAERYIKAGAHFIVSPCMSRSVLNVCQNLIVPYVPGCGTVTEIFNSQQLGCEIAKLFPGDVYGPQMIQATLAPMPWSKIMVTGGVSPDKDNLQAWFKAGAWCVGMGSRLFPKEVLEAQDWQTITRKCKECFEVIKPITQPS